MNLNKQVEEVGRAWRVSTYYESAEKWIHIFWSEKSAFRLQFEKLDLTHAVELACGHGRHVPNYIKKSKKLTLVDLHQENIDVCMRRFDGHDNISFIKNNGLDFYPLDSGSVSAVFSYDAMVHFSPDIVASYLRDAYRVLIHGGRALFHHSNYDAPVGVLYGSNPHARNRMTETLFCSLCTDAGLQLEETQSIGWGGIPDLDRLSILRKT